MKSWLLYAVLAMIIVALTAFFLSFYSYRLFEWPTRGHCSIRL